MNGGRFSDPDKPSADEILLIEAGNPELLFVSQAETDQESDYSEETVAVKAPQALSTCAECPKIIA